MEKKILIIDDDTRNIFALALTLKTKGYPCLSATSAIEGLAVLKHHPQIGIVLLDMMMPDMDGYQTLSAIKGDRQYAHLPVIAVTAQAMRGDREKCLEAGADDYIAKPIDVDKLLQVLEKYGLNPQRRI
ncbi:response regulator [Parapedobacter koreensis]|uniref:Response regulator receiver domain-containing protein n=1 Tax=Parapedobacter koreensis TaxID=332977 RepID=A0A1H7GXJ4_9SPHI|nr:response regulator [Parapedobacter koreensis]SEK40605.1 Response regulator receiver domain-containing protein [Parapedobacter koreensis]